MEMQRIEFEGDDSLIKRVETPEIPKFSDGVLTVRLRKCKTPERYTWRVAQKGNDFKLYANGDKDLPNVIPDIVAHAVTLIKMQVSPAGFYRQLREENAREYRRS